MRTLRKTGTSWLRKAGTYWDSALYRGLSSPHAREPSGGHLTGQDLDDKTHPQSRGSETVSTGSGHLGVHIKQVGEGWQSPSWLHLECRLYLIRVPTFSFGITSLAHLVALSHLPFLKHMGRETDQGTEGGPCRSLLHCSHHAPVPLSPWRLPRFISPSRVFLAPTLCFGVRCQGHNGKQNKRLHLEGSESAGREFIQINSSSNAAG